MKMLELAGERFGRLQALWPAGKRYHSRVYWACQCDDGNIVVVSATDLRTGHTYSCGCAKADAARARSLTHGGYQSVEYRAYHEAKKRCTNPSNRMYHVYGSRGIKFLFSDFEQFLKDIGPKPSPDLTLDRIRNDGHYEVGNVRWATRTTQNRNRRPSCEWKGRKA